MASDRVTLPEEALFDRHYLPAGGIAMHARVSRPAVAPDREPVVLVHGLGLSGRYMLPLAARLATRYRVYLPDLPGFGDSEHPGHAGCRRRGWAERAARSLPQGRLVVIPGVAHTLVFTAPLEMDRVCRPFLDKARAAA